jgi:hypothetical protein
MLCTMGALAQYLFWRFELAREPPPDFRTRQSWYKIKLLVGKNVCEELSYDAQRETTWRILTKAEAVGSKVTHMPRVKGTQDGERRGGEKPEVSLSLLKPTELSYAKYLSMCTASDAGRLGS